MLCFLYIKIPDIFNLRIHVLDGAWLKAHLSFLAVFPAEIFNFDDDRKDGGMMPDGMQAHEPM